MSTDSQTIRVLQEAPIDIRVNGFPALTSFPQTSHNA